MKYLGPIVDNKDLVNKEYVDTAIAGTSGGSTYDLASTASHGLLHMLPNDNNINSNKFFLNGNNAWTSDINPNTITFSDNNDKFGNEDLTISSWIKFLKFREKGSLTISDANDAPFNTLLHFSDTEAAQWSNLPIQEAGFLTTLSDDNSDRHTQFFYQTHANHNSKNIYTRDNMGGSWNSWEKITLQSLTTDWQIPGTTSFTRQGGGYYQEGKHCYISYYGKLTSTVAANTNRQIGTGFPVPQRQAYLSGAYANNPGMAAYIDTDGTFHVKNSSSMSTASFLRFEGHYLTA